MGNGVTKKTKLLNELAKNKSSLKNAINTKKSITSINKKLTPEKNVSTKTTKITTVKNTPVKTTKSSNDIEKVVKKSASKKKNTVKKSNTYQYNKRNLSKNKKAEVKEKEIIKEEILDFDKTIKIERVVEKKDVKPIKNVIKDAHLNKNDNKEVEILDVTGYIKVNGNRDKSKEEILDDTLTELEKLSIREDNNLDKKKSLPKKEKKDDFYPFDEEEIELLDEDTMYKTLRLDLYNVYDKDNDFKENKNSKKTVENIEDKLLLVDNILTEESRKNIVSKSTFIKEEDDDNEYYNVVLWDSIIGFLLVIFTTLTIFAIWFIVYLTTY